MSDNPQKEQKNFAGLIAAGFIKSKITPLLIIAALFIGLVSVAFTPKEEEPQIVVPMVDIIVPYPGADAEDIEKTVSEPLEKIVWEIPGVDYVYSISSNDHAMVIVRFVVGMDEEEAVTRLKMKIDYNMDRMPHGVRMPIIKKQSIDDVPQVALTFWSDEYDSYHLRRIAGEVEKELKEIENVSKTNVMGGYRRVIRVEPEIEKLKAYNLDLFMLSEAIESSNVSLNTGEITSGNEVMYITAGGFFENVQDVEQLVVGVYNGKAVHLRDVAKIIDGPEVPDTYTLMGMREDNANKEYQAVTLSIAKRQGSDSVVVAEDILNKLETLKQYLIPEGVQVEVTRNYGHSAYEKVKTLIEHLAGAIVSVIIVMTLAMGWRAGLVVFVALPVTFAMTLFVYYMFDYTLNRVTLFALIFVTGLVVDDAIIVVENIERHFKMGRKNLFERAVKAVDEVGNPTILATLTVIIAVYPMAFVRGLMGPYMKPMPIGASLAMIFSLIVALTITPWLAYKLLGSKKHKGEDVENEEDYIKQTRLYKLYQRSLLPFLCSGKKRFLLTVVMLGLFAGAFLFIPTKMVVMKMLPFDNKNELQIIIDMPEGTSLEQTTMVASEVGRYLTTVEQVEDYQIYAGHAAPMNFNGLVRHYFMRSGSNVADIQVNFVDKSKRSLKSHDLAKVLREPVQKIGTKYNANIKITEVPPGPPVLSTLVAEVYAPTVQDRRAVAAMVEDVFLNEKGVVDVDTYIEDDMKKLHFRVNKDKAAILGVSSEMVSNTLYIALQGLKTGVLHTGIDREDVDIIVQLKESSKNAVNAISGINIMSKSGRPVALSELVEIREGIKTKPVYHKNIQPVTYITADVAGEVESPVYAILSMKKKIEKLTYKGQNIEQLWIDGPHYTGVPSVKWDGEWQITYEVFRDLGLAFAAVLILMYFVLVGWFKSFVTPIIMMVPIPLSLLGIIPGHFLFGEFFTATSMIGFIALAGIMVRNAILLIDFIESSLKQGQDLQEAVIQSGAIRTRPIFLTAITVVVGAMFMLPDPIFSGLGVALITGSVVSTVLTLGIIPLIYFFYKKYQIEKQERKAQ